MIPPVTLVKYSPQRMQGINKNAGKYSQSSWCRWTTFQSHGNICIHQVSIVVPVCVIEHSSWASIQYKFKLYHHWVGSLLYFFVFIHFTHTLWSEKKFEGNSKEVTYKVVVSLITKKRLKIQFQLDFIKLCKYIISPMRISRLTHKSMACVN